MNLDEIFAIRDRHSIIEVLERFGAYPPVRWNRASDFMISCPTPGHEDRTPSCIVHPQTDHYFCFGCGAHGDVLQLVQDVRGRAPLREVVAFLEAGAIPDVNSERSVPRRSKETLDLSRTPLPRVLEVNEIAWRELTQAQFKSTAQRYLERRGVDIGLVDVALARPCVGYTPAQRDGLTRRLTGHGFSEAEIIDSGWAISIEGRLFDRFYRRVMFPVIANDGSVRGAIGRDISEVAKSRYLNTPRTVAYCKSEHLYWPRPVEKDVDAIVVCEGPIDALMVTCSLERSATNVAAVAVGGTALTAQHAEAIRSTGATRALICSDSDAAGDKAGVEWTCRLATVRMPSSRLRPPRGLDPAVWFASSTAEANRSLQHSLNPRL